MTQAVRTFPADNGKNKSSEQGTGLVIPVRILGAGISHNDSIGNMCCQATKNALYLAGYALFGCEIFLNTPPGFLFSPIRGHKNGQAFAIMNEKGDCNYA